MRLLLLLLIAAGIAYYTLPTREAHEAAARAYLEGRAPGESAEEGLSLESMVGYVKGMFAGEGRYESFFLVSKYSVDLPGASYLECYGAFALVQCSEVQPGAPS